jgi:hypothetical protein
VSRDILSAEYSVDRQDDWKHFGSVVVAYFKLQRGGTEVVTGQQKILETPEFFRLIFQPRRLAYLSRIDIFITDVSTFF